MLDREIAGITCRGVLDHLEAYLAGGLHAEEIGRIEAHLAECDRCARFGGAYARICRDLRELLGEPEPLDRAVRERLAQRLDASLAAAERDRDAPG